HISYSTAPKENRSVRASSSFPRTCSGDMYATVPSVLPGLVRCSVVNSACCQCFPGFRCARCGIHLGQSKVQNLGVAPFGNEKVGWLDVPVNDSFGMRRIQRVGHFDAEIKQALHAHWAARYGVLEGFPLQILHGDEPPIALLADFINGADVR